MPDRRTGTSAPRESYWPFPCVSAHPAAGRSCSRGSFATARCPPRAIASGDASRTIFGALLVLELAQILLAWSLARRIRRRRTEREDLADTGVVDTGVVDNGVIDTGIVGSALTDLLTRAHGTGIATTLDTVDLHDPLPPAVAELVYRAAREALRDVLTHADATSVTVRVSDHDHVATLDVVDDGTGANTGSAEGKAEAAHLGVRALTDLVADAGGRLVVDSANGKGTRVHVEVPLP